MIRSVKSWRIEKWELFLDRDGRMYVGWTSGDDSIRGGYDRIRDDPAGGERWRSGFSQPHLELYPYTFARLFKVVGVEATESLTIEAADAAVAKLRNSWRRLVGELLLGWR